MSFQHQANAAEIAPSPFQGAGCGAKTTTQRLYANPVANFATFASELGEENIVNYFANAVVHPDTGASLEYRALLKTDLREKYLQANINEIGRLTDGRVGDHSVVPTKTMAFIPANELPADKKPTYLCVVCDYRPQKEFPHRVRWTAGGDKIDYPGEKSTPTADLVTAKLLFK